MHSVSVLQGYPSHVLFPWPPEPSGGPTVVGAWQVAQSKKLRMLQSPLSRSNMDLTITIIGSSYDSIYLRGTIVWVSLLGGTSAGVCCGG